MCKCVVERDLCRLRPLRDRLLNLLESGRDDAADADPNQCTVHVGGLDMYTDADQQSSYEAELSELFGEFGTVLAVQVRIRQSSEQGVKKCSWALVTFSLASEAQVAIATAASRLPQRESHRTHRLQGATQLGALRYIAAAGARSTTHQPCLSCRCLIHQSACSMTHVVR